MIYILSVCLFGLESLNFTTKNIQVKYAKIHGYFLALSLKFSKKIKIMIIKMKK